MSAFSRESCVNTDGDLSYKRIKDNLLGNPRSKREKWEKNRGNQECCIPKGSNGRIPKLFILPL